MSSLTSGCRKKRIWNGKMNRYGDAKKRKKEEKI